MPKIKKIKVKNYQSHKNTEMELSPGMNAIYGGSDQGKSSILRALDCVFFRGKFYMRSGENWGEVDVEFDDPLSTHLSRSKSIKLNNVSEKLVLGNVTFRKIGKQIPEEVTAFTKIKPIELNDGSMLNLNYQSQHSSKFLLGDQEYSSAYRARVTSMAGSDTLDRASQEAAKEHRKVKSDLNELTSNGLVNVNASLSHLDALPSMLQQYKAWKLQRDELELKYNSTLKLKELSESLLKLQSIKYVNRNDILMSMKKILMNLEILQLLHKFIEITKPIVIPVIPNLNSIEKLSLIRRGILKLQYSQVEFTNMQFDLRNKKDKLNELKLGFDVFMQGMGQCPLCGK